MVKTLEKIVREENERDKRVLLDWPELFDASLQKEALIRKLLALYVQQLPEWLSEISGSVQEMDVVRVRRICHTVKGATGALHAPACVELLESLNRAAREGTLTDLPKVLPEVIAVLEKTGRLIERLLDA